MKIGKDGRDALQQIDTESIARMIDKTVSDRMPAIVFDGHRKLMVTNYGEQKEYSLPVMMYRGVYKNSESYEAGDVVTCGGSMFHCNKDDPEGSPGNSDDWQQCVKKGRDSR